MSKYRVQRAESDPRSLPSGHLTSSKSLYYCVSLSQQQNFQAFSQLTATQVLHQALWGCLRLFLTSVLQLGSKKKKSFLRFPGILWGLPNNICLDTWNQFYSILQTKIGQRRIMDLAMFQSLMQEKGHMFPLLWGTKTNWEILLPPLFPFYSSLERKSF